MRPAKPGWRLPLAAFNSTASLGASLLLQAGPCSGHHQGRCASGVDRSAAGCLPKVNGAATWGKRHTIYV